jgi:arsenite-transporting ATPase
MQHAPGLEEHALLLAFRRIVKNENKIAGIYFDMPPTAMTLRFLSLPKLSQTWLNELLRLRGHIKEKREIISRIKFGKRELEEDPVITRLKQMIRDQQSLQQLLQTSDSHFRIVSSPDCVSLSETMRIRERFSEMEYTVESLILNRSSTHQPEALPDELSGIPRHTVPQADYPLIGLPALRRFIAETGE